MAKIKTKTYSFDVPGDAVKARVYYLPGSVAPTYDSPFQEVDIPSGMVTVAVQIPGPMSIGEGVYTLGASALDAAGNESDIGAVVTHPFDFTAPTAPVNGKVS